MRDIKAVLVVIATIGVIIAAAVAGVTLLGGGKKDKPEPTMSGDLDETEKTNAKAVSVDPFDGLEVTFSGISPNAVMNNIDRKTKEGAWVSYTCKPSDGLVLGQKVTVTASLQDTVNYRLKNKEQVYTVEGVDAYITRLSDVTGDVIKKMREKAEAEFTDHTVSRWPSGAKLEGMSYCGMYFLTPKDPASVRDQNRATLVYKVDIQSDRKISCYTYTTFFDLIKKTDGSITLDINRYEVPQAGSSGDDQVSAAGIRMAGYTDPERLKKTCVTDQSGYYRCESSVAKLDSLTIPEDASETTAEETAEEKDTEETAVPDTTEEGVDDVVETDEEESDDTAETEKEGADDVVETDTEEPEVTTKAPETTTKAPETTTIAPETTTEAPETTTIAPETTTEAPETTTMAPETTTESPETTTMAPKTTTEAPETTTMAPETTTEAPEITTDEDDTEEIAAVIGTDETGTTAEEQDEEDVEEPDEEDGEEPDGLTGYDKVLDDYRKALNGDVQDSFRGLPDVQTDPAKTFFYAFYDLNGDGQDELIVTNRLLLREPEEEAVEEPDEEEAEEPDEDVVEEPDEETPEDAEDEEEEEEEIAEEPEEDEEPEAKEPREWDPMTASDPAEVRPDELHVLTMEMPDSGEEEEELLTQARELICDTEDEHYTILSDHTIRCSQAGTDAQYYAVDEFGGLDELSSDPEALSSLKELYFDSSIWKPVLNPDGE